MPNAHHHTVNGVTATFGEHCRLAGLHTGTVRMRLRKGMSIEQALLAPKWDRPLVTYRGVTRDLDGWAAWSGICRKTLEWRLAQGWTPERMLETPAARGRQVEW